MVEELEDGLRCEPPLVGEIVSRAVRVVVAA
jgi:hypothetical protein